MSYHERSFLQSVLAGGVEVLPVFVLGEGDDDGRDLVVSGTLSPPVQVLDATEQNSVNRKLGKINLTFTRKAG